MYNIVCIYVCMYNIVCIYVCMYACMYVCMYICMYVDVLYQEHRRVVQLPYMHVEISKTKLPPGNIVYVQTSKSGIG